MSKVELTILGDPMGKQRPRYSMNNGVVRTYTPQKTINYESLIVHEYNQKYGKVMFDKEEYLKVFIVAYFSLPKSCYGKKGLNKSGKEKMSKIYCTKHVDIDNIAKVVLDALNGICYYDDKQVAVLSVMKLWTTETPKVEVHIYGEKEDEDSI